MPHPTLDSLVMLHGWGMNSAVWSGFDPLPDRLAPLPLALPGHDGQPFDAARTSVWDWADDCLGRAPERAVWLGWSLGGLVALAAALRAPRRVAALVLITATPRFIQAADWRVAMPEETLAQFHDSLLAEPTATLDRFLALQVRGSEAARETLRKLRAELAARPAPNPAALAQGLDLLRDEDLRGRLPDIRCPTLWLFGSHDSLTPAAVAERIELLMPEAHTAIIPGAAHVPQLSHPEDSRACIANFLIEALA